MTPTPAAPSGELPRNERVLRRLLAYRCAGSLLYDPDDELQDNTVEPYIDFKRDSVDVIEEKLIERGRAAVSQAAPEQAALAELRTIIDRVREGALDWPKGWSGTASNCERALKLLDALAAPSGAPKQEIPAQTGIVEAVIAACLNERLTDEDGTSPSDIAYNMAIKHCVTAIRELNLAAASTVQSAPVLPKLPESWVIERTCSAPDGYRVEAEGAAWAIVSTSSHEPIQMLLALLAGEIWTATRRAAQSTPVQVDGQQEPQAHVMPPFAAPAGQPDASSTVMVDLMPKRAAFVAWAKNRRLDVTEEKDAWGERKFGNYLVQLLWEGWFHAPAIYAAPEQSSTAGAAKGGIDEPNSAVQAVALPVAAAPGDMHVAFNPNEKCSPTLTQCPRCNNPHNACDQTFGAAAPEQQP